MKALLICPGERPAVAELLRQEPLALVPILGQSLLEHWLEHFARNDVTQVYVLASDRPERVRAIAGDGSRWGICISVIPDRQEVTVEEARVKYVAAEPQNWIADGVVLMDHPPGTSQSLFNSYADWFATVAAWIPQAVTSTCVGVYELKPGIWIGPHTQVAPDAELRAPCWLGADVRIGPGAEIGPMAIIEDRSWVEDGAKISHSIVAPETFVGQLCELKDSLALGTRLVNWRKNICFTVGDTALLCALRQRTKSRATGWLGRAAALVTLILTSPFALFATEAARRRGEWPVRYCRAIRPGNFVDDLPEGEVLYQELNTTGWLRRWPQLWNVARGEFAWVGNRPVARENASKLANAFERQWLAAPIGLVSLSDAEHCQDPFGDEARAHASYYAARGTWRLDCFIMAQGMARLMKQTLRGHGTVPQLRTARVREGVV